MSEDGYLTAEGPATKVTADSLQAQEVLGKVNRHLLPLFFCVALLCNMDRGNLAFAAPQLSADLKFTKADYGFGSGVFFLGYAVFQVPATLLCARLGAPRFLGTSLVCWGAVASLFASVRSAPQFYVLRFVLGLCETGAYPGMWYHLSTFLDDTELGVAYATVTTASALSAFVGGPVAALLLSMNGFAGLKGWQWLFLLEGMPTVGLGVLLWKRLALSPATAGCLQPDERSWLVARQARVVQTRRAALTGSAAGEGRWWGFALQWRIWYIAAIWGLTSVALDGLQFWGPTILQAILYKGQNGGIPSAKTDKEQLHRAVVAALLSAIPYGFAALGMVVIARHAKARKERHWHSGGSLFTGAAAAAALALTLGKLPWLAFCAFGVALLGIWGVHGPLLSWPAVFLDNRSAASGFAFVKMIGAIGGFAGPSMIGLLAVAEDSYAASMAVLACCLLLGGGMCLGFTEPGVPSLLTASGWRLPRYKRVGDDSDVSETFLPTLVPLAEAPALPHSRAVMLQNMQNSQL